MHSFLLSLETALYSSLKCLEVFKATFIESTVGILTMHVATNCLFSSNALEKSDSFIVFKY